MQLGGRRFLLTTAIIAAAVCLVLGLVLPAIRLTQFFFFSTDHSLVSTIQALISTGQIFLGLSVALFSALLPLLKLFYLLALATLPGEELHRRGRQLRAMDWLGRWSMQDVLIMALMIFFIKTQGIFDASSLYGIYFFTAAVVLMLVAYQWLRAMPMRAPDGSLGSAGGIVAGGNKIAKPPYGSAAIYRNFILSLFIILAAIFFTMGIIFPVVRFTTVYVWTKEHSILTVIYALYQNDKFSLSFILFIISIFFPILKLTYLITLLISPHMPYELRNWSIHIIEWLGRYSMADVMVLSLMIFYVNSSGYAEAEVLSGVYFFAASTLMTMFAYGWANTIAPVPHHPLAPSVPKVGVN